VGKMCRFGKNFVFGLRVRLGKEYGESWNNMGKGGHGKGDWGWTNSCWGWDGRV
jgi:hypothetical protein